MPVGQRVPVAHLAVKVVRLRYHPALRLVGASVARPVVFLIKQEFGRDKWFKLFQALLQDVAVFNVKHGRGVAQRGVAAEEAVDVLHAVAYDHELFLVEGDRVVFHFSLSLILKIISISCLFCSLYLSTSLCRKSISVVQGFMLDVGHYGKSILK